MDILSSIPDELWREIFALIPASWIYGADLSSDPLRQFRSHEKDFIRIKDTQFDRLALMMVCRAMLPLAEELLYSEVYISNPTAAKRFIETAGLNQDGRPSRGWWTRRISIDTVGWTLSSETTTFETLKEACPNITCLHTEQEWWGIHASSVVKRMVPEYSSLLRDLRTLTVTGVSFKIEDLPEIATQCPNLIHLHLCPSVHLYGQSQSITFPSLRRLSISSHLLHFIADAKTKFLLPLKWLSITVSGTGDIPAIHRFCHQHGSNLVGLELCFALGKYISELATLPSDFLDFGTNLRTLVIPPSFAMDSTGGSTMMEKLKEVILRAGVYHSTFSAPAFAEYFAPSRFPRLDRIILVLQTPSSYDGPAICDEIRELLPDVLVEMRSDYQ